MPDDQNEEPLTFGELRDALMPPGADKEALWAALKASEVKGPAKDQLLGKIAEFHQTGGHRPGVTAPDVSYGGGTTCASCNAKGIYATHVPLGDECRLVQAVAEKNAREAERCCVCGSTEVVYHNYRDQPFCAPCADGEKPPGLQPSGPPDPFAAMTPGAVAMTGMHEAFSDLTAAGFTEDQALRFLAYAWAAAQKDTPGG